MFTREFWRATGERAVRTAAQATLGVVGADGLGLLEVGWGEAGTVGGLAAVAAVLTAVATSGAGPEGPGLTETIGRRW
jgi:hypothetical protein